MSTHKRKFDYQAGYFNYYINHHVMQLDTHCHDSMICRCGSVVTLLSYDIYPYQLTLFCASLWMAL